jgi:GDSL-like lipase/acylhydrolase family protein
MVRDKTKNAIVDHLAALKPTDRFILMGDSHSERLVWKHPELAPKDTWICAVGGDSVPRLSYRVKNPEGTGYAQVASVGDHFEKILLLIGGNDLKDYVMNAGQIESVADGLDELVKTLNSRWPKAQVLVLPVIPPPSHGKPRVNYDRLNAVLAKRGTTTDLLSWNDLTDQDYVDHGHLNPDGYRKFLTKLMKLGVKCADVHDVVDKKTPVERRIALLQKKLLSIAKVEGALARNEPVEKTQLDLVGRKGSIEKELRDLQEW